MRRVLVVGVIGLMSALHAVGAGAAPAPFQPDVSIGERGDAVFAGEDLYDADAAGEIRSVIIERKAVVVVHVQNDGTGPCTYLVAGSAAAAGFRVRYRLGHDDVTSDVVAGRLNLPDVPPGATRRLTVVIRSTPATELGAEQPVEVRAVCSTEPDQVDAARATVTEVAEQEGP